MIRLPGTAQRSDRAAQQVMSGALLMALLAGLALMLSACDMPHPSAKSAPLIPAEAHAPTPDGMVRIPGGPFVMGTDETDVDGRGEELGLMVTWFDSAHPAHRVDLPAFYMDITEVSNRAYAQFVSATHIHPPPHWGGRPHPPEGLENHPVTHVSYDESMAYCRWSGKTLPSEAQWEKAARGTDQRTYPWGNDYHHDWVNVARGHTTPVGSLPDGASPYGVQDMIGNVWEWTSSDYLPYPGSTYQDDKFGTRVKVLRGNSWASVGHYPDRQDFMDIVSNNSRATYRLFLTPAGRLNDVGLRCVKPA